MFTDYWSVHYYFMISLVFATVAYMKGDIGQVINRVDDSIGLKLRQVI